MIFFITFLRALATCLISNAHYTGVYPTDLIANGGLIGDVIFLRCLVIVCITFEETFLNGTAKGFGDAIFL